MIVLLVRFFNLLLAALVAGTIFGIWIGYNPMELSALAYIEQQQNAIRALNVLMPLLGLITILITLLSEAKSNFYHPAHGCHISYYQRPDHPFWQSTY